MTGWSIISPKRERARRKQMWEPSVATPADMERGRSFVEKWGPPDPSMHTSVRRYEEMCRASNCSPYDEQSLMMALGQMLAAGLSAGSLETYVKAIAKIYFPQGARRLLPAVQRAHADSDSSHAPDLPDPVLKQLIEKLSSPFKATAYMMMYTGIRMVGLRWLRRRQIVLQDNGSIKVQVKVDKNKKRRVMRQDLLIPASLIDRPARDVRRFLVEGDSEERLFATVTITTLNAALKKAARKLSCQRPTSYSYRRAFMNRIRKHCNKTGEDPARYTMHISKNILEAHYKRFSED